MRMEQTTREGCAIVAVRGHLRLSTVGRLRHVLLKRLADRPVAVICDLSELWAVDPVCATLFASLANHPASGWPMTNLLLCGAQPAVADVLHRVRLPYFVPVCATLEDALDSATARPAYLRDELAMAPSPAAPAAARRFVREVCRQWRLEELHHRDGSAGPATVDGLADLADRAVLLADELVTNAVLHGGAGELRLRAELSDDGLRLAVHDAAPHLLHTARSPDAEAESGRGLMLVEELASAWGVHPGPGGKVVWCLLRTAAPAAH